MKRSTHWILLGSLAFWTGDLFAGALDFKAPSGLKLPIPISPAEAGWRQDGSLYLLDIGKVGYLEVPAWWQGNRPPRGELVVLELEYLDDFRHPVIAEVYSALGTSDPYSELHRFGGSGDGTWKHARIPVSSDFIFLTLPDRTLRFKLNPSDGTLKIRSATLQPPVDKEEALYNDETRAWVAREQDRAVISSRYYELAQVPVLPGEWATRPLVPYVRNWMDLVRPISAPQAGEAGTAVRLQMFLNESEPAQIGVFANGVDLRRVEVIVDPVLDEAGRKVVQASARVAEYSKVRGQSIPGFLIEPFPQRLWPAFPFDVAAGSSHLVWVDFRTEEGVSRPGSYASKVRFKADGIPEASVPIQLEVLDSRLLTMEEAGLKLGGCTTGLVPEFELTFLRQNNHNMVNIWYASIRPELAAGSPSFEMDFRIMDDWMAAAKRQGISDLVYFLGGNPYGFPRTMNLPRTLAGTVLGMDDEAWGDLQMRDPGRVPPRVAELITEWARRFGDHAQREGWPNVVLTPFDEPAKYTQYRSGLGMLSFIKPQFKEQVRLLRKGIPGVQIYGSIHHYDPGMDFLEDVDVFCTNAVSENAAMPDEVRSAGKILWEYSGTSDKGLPAVARYTFGYYFAAHDSRGSLVWAYNWGNRFDTLDGSNWMYVWNTPFDVIPTPYLAGLREAWDDRRLLETLKRTAAQENRDLSLFLGRLYADIIASRGKGGQDTVDDFWDRAKEDQVMDEWKERMVRELLAIKEAR